MNTSRFGLSRGILSDMTFIELAEKEYRSLIASKQTILSALDAEEAFDVLLENFMELEKGCLAIAVEEMVCSSNSYSSFHARRRRVARLLSNVLSACRAYLDFLNHIDAVMRAEGAPKERVTKARHHEYETRIGYRVMDALRNYAQHRGLPVDSITLGGERDGEYWVHRIRLSMMVSRLRDREEKAKVLKALKEAEQRGDRLDLLPLLRDYVSGIAAIHEQFRNWHDADIRSAEALVFSMLERMAAACGSTKPVHHCIALHEPPDGCGAERTDIFPDLVEYRRELVGKNRALMNLERRYVTGRDAA